METAVLSARYNHPPKWDMGFHQHVEYELTVVFQGTAMFECNGVVYRLEAGHVVIIPPYLPHRFSSIKQVQIGSIHFRDIPQKLITLFYKLTTKGNPRISFLPPLDLVHYENMFQIWLKMISKTFEFRNNLLQTWIELFIVYIYQHVKEDFRPFSVSSAANYISDNLDKEIVIAELAQKAHTSITAFRNEFIATFGVTPKIYHQQCRLAQAKWLLQSTNDSEQTIAKKIGFTSIHPFSRWFHRMEGMPPTKWRKFQQENIKTL